MTTVLDRLTAWVEKQSSIGPAAFKSMRAEIEREVAKEQRGAKSKARKAKPRKVKA